MHPSASPLVTSSIGAVALGVALAVITGYARVAPSRRAALAFAAGALAWLAATGALGASGALTHWDRRPPLGMLLPPVSLGLVVALARSRVGERLARGLPLAALVAFEGFRLPLELVMHRAAVEGTMPEQMSFAGYNFDVVTGASALVVAALVHKGLAPRALVAAWNALGLTLLAVIVGIAIASTPVFSAFGPARLNTWVAWFPFVWMITVNVPAALFGHLVVARRLALERATRDAALTSPT